MTRGWPPDLPPPGAEDWQRRAVGWLLDQCPPDFRGYDVLRKHPSVLARFTAAHLEACEKSVQHGLATARHDLRAMGPSIVDDVIGVYETELARLAKARLATDAIARAFAQA